MTGEGEGRGGERREVMRVEMRMGGGGKRRGRERRGQERREEVGKERRGFMRNSEFWKNARERSV